MTGPEERLRALRQILDQRVLVIDGAMGTMIHQVPLSVNVDYEGHENCPEIDGAMGTMIHQVPLSVNVDYEGHENCPEILVVTRPDVIENIHRYYFDEIGR